VKAIICQGHGSEEVLRVADLAPPTLGQRDVRLSVTAAGLNRADLLQRRGLYPPPPGVTDILGLECAGTVIECGLEVPNVDVGSTVMALVPGGGQAEEAVVDVGSVMPVPSGLDGIAAGAFPEVYLTAFFNLFQLGGLEPGMTALVHGGSGGVGTAAIQLIGLAGATSVVTAGSDERCRRCLQIGAEEAVNWRDGDFVAAARRVTGGRGVDVVLDCVGAPYLVPNTRALAPDGRLVIIGLMGGHTGELDLRRLLAKRLTVAGSTLRSQSVRRKAEIAAAFLERFGSDLARGSLRPVIDSVFDMGDVAEAHRRLASGDAFGKVVLRIA
jgi:putative PIG3 family NAD(P)H quinone oxidoreductase